MHYIKFNSFFLIQLSPSFYKWITVHYNYFFFFLTGYLVLNFVLLSLIPNVFIWMLIPVRMILDYALKLDLQLEQERLIWLHGLWNAIRDLGEEVWPLEAVEIILVNNVILFTKTSKIESLYIQDLLLSEKEVYLFAR